MSNNKNMIGSKIGIFTIFDKKRENNHTYYLCECPYCGEKKWIRGCNAQKGKSCGCMQYKIDTSLVGSTINYLKIIEPIRIKGKVNFKCVCVLCGNTIITSLAKIKSGEVKACGCLRGEKLKKGFVENTNLYNLRSEKPKK